MTEDSEVEKYELGTVISLLLSCLLVLWGGGYFKNMFVSIIT